MRVERMRQSSACSVKRVGIAMVSRLKTDVNINVFIVSVSVFVNSQVGCITPQLKRLSEGLPLFFSIPNVWCERFDFVRQILSKRVKKILIL